MLGLAPRGGYILTLAWELEGRERPIFLFTCVQSRASVSELGAAGDGTVVFQVPQMLSVITELY